MDKEEKPKMNSALIKKYPNLPIKIDYKKLLDNVEVPKVKDGVVILNPNNPSHVKWLEDEDGEEQKMTDHQIGNVYKAIEIKIRPILGGYC